MRSITSPANRGLSTSDEGAPAISSIRSSETSSPVGASKSLEPHSHREKASLQLRLERLLLIALVILFAVKGFIPAWQQLNSDFPNYYLIARLYRAGVPLERVYDWTWLQRQKDHEGIKQGLVSFIPSTLPSALLILPWCSLSPLAAKHHWLIVNLILLLGVIVLLVRLTKLAWERVAILTFLAFLPLRNNFLFGQMHIVVLLLITLAAWLFFREFEFTAGIGLAIAAVLKIYPALFLIYFVWKRQWRAAMGLLGGLAIAGMTSLYLFGKDACVVYVQKVLPAGLRGETIDPYSPAWNSWTALLRRLFISEPELNPSPVAHLPWLYALLQPLIHGLILVAFLWAIGRQKPESDRAKVEWASFLFLLLFLSSQPGSYHFVVLIFSAVLVQDYLLARGQKNLALMGLVIYALICVAPMIRIPRVTAAGWSNLLFFPRLMLMTIFAGVLLWILFSGLRQSLREQFHARRMAVAMSALMVLTAAGFIATEKHLRGQFDDYNHRIASTPGSLLEGDPAPISDGILFTRMTSKGYTIGRLRGSSDVELAPEGDSFHATSSNSSGAIWAEQATNDGSRVVGLESDSAAIRIASETAIGDAEEPVVSADGRRLAFLRPVKGRNSLWIWKIGAPGMIPDAPQQVAVEDYDVREASFLLDHRVIFSSRRAGRFRFFAAAESGKIEELKWPNCSARYPAPSPDGKWLAFACEQGAASEIHIANMAGEQDLQLTHGDCNSISPTWTADSKTLVYATDCGRGLGLTALAEITIFH
jgi:hypothetical protein